MAFNVGKLKILNLVFMLIFVIGSLLNIILVILQRREWAAITVFCYASVLDLVGVFMAGIFTILAALCSPYYFYLYSNVMKDFIDDLKGTVSKNLQNSSKEVLKQSVTHTSVDIIELGVLDFIFIYAAGVIFSYCSSRQVYKIRRKVFENILKQDMTWYDSHNTGDLAVILSENFAKIEDGLGEKLIYFLFNQTLFVACTIWSLFIGWKLSLTCLIPVPILIFIISAVPKYSRQISNKASDSFSKAGTIAEEAFRNIRTVVTFNGQNVEIERYEKQLLDVKVLNIKNCLSISLKNGILWFVRYAGSALPWWYGFQLASEADPEENVYSPARVIMICTNICISSLYFTMSCIYLEVFGIACGAAEKIFELLDCECKSMDVTPQKLKLNKLDGSITFDNVVFRYPSRKDVNVLRSVSINIKPRQTVAFVGPSGSGKSTCIQLLERFYDSDSGKICIDEIDIKNFDLSWLRRNIGLVSQEATLFADTIAENIRFGKITATQAEVVRAAKTANVHSFISSLPKGYDTVIGERGMQLSGGQKQKIAIARALIRKPSILLLDEATSALDVASEAEVQATLDSMIGQCTTIMIAHRLSTIKNADRIFVFSEGEVVESGTFLDLMNTKGYFYTLEQSQKHQYSVSSTNIGTIPEINAVNNLKYTEREEEEEISSKNQDTGRVENNKHIITEILQICKLEWKWIILSILSSLGMAVCPYAYAVTFVDLLLLFSMEDQYLMKQYVKYNSIFLFVLGLVAGLSYALQSYCFGRIGENLTLRIRTKMFATIMKQDMEWFDKKENGVGALCGRISSDGNAIQAATGLACGISVGFTSASVLCIVLSFYYQWKLSLVLTPFLLFSALFVVIQERGTKYFASKRKEKLLENSKLATAAINDIRTVIAYSTEDYFLQRYTEQLLPCLSLSRIISLMTSAIVGLSSSMDILNFGTGFLYGINLTMSGEADYEVVTKVSVMMYSASWAVGITLSFIPNLQNGLRASKSIQALFMSEPKLDSVGSPSDEIWENGKIEYKNVSFSYPTRPSFSILQELNLSIQPGKTLALVGSTGCGKTSIIQLLQRFYDPTSGTITVDNSDIKRVNLKYHRANFGVVSQEPSLFNRTIAENIAYGDNSRKVTKEEIIEAAKNANIHNFISSLPQGYDTMLGVGASEISGGQKQRIAIARALARNPKILILDEATSALDNESERKVQDALDRAKEGRTCITIAHRLSTVQNADIICVIDRGKIIEMGNHKELMSRRGFYYELNIF